MYPASTRLITTLPYYKKRRTPASPIYNLRIPAAHMIFPTTKRAPEMYRQEIFYRKTNGYQSLNLVELI